ncbi:hypothetical protein Bbelb_434520 [Branchiostoma belcheri]|nr:hypothetical protein Bbelb_434520 [Branchiostoma belcheri]
MIENGIAGLYGHGINRVDTSLAVVPRSSEPRVQTAIKVDERYHIPGCLPNKLIDMSFTRRHMTVRQRGGDITPLAELDVVRVAHLSADKWKQENAPPHVEQTELLSICQLNVYRLASLGCIPQQQTPGVGRSCRPAQGTDAKFSAHRQPASTGNTGQLS